VLIRLSVERNLAIEKTKNPGDRRLEKLPLMSKTASSTLKTDFDAIVVGAGFAGLYMLYKLRSLGLSARLFETGSGVGGTWFWNRYPGARCDVFSLEYCYSFDDQLQQDWVWTERYPAQAEILSYIEHVADRFDLRRDIQFNTRVTAAEFIENEGVWQVETDAGETASARFCIMASGALSASRKPDFEGLDDFGGTWYHTGQWPHQPVDFTGQRVAVIGTGSSGIQVTPMLAEQAAELIVFQRTPNFSIPAWNYPLSDAQQEDWKSRVAQHRAVAKASKSGALYQYSQRSAFEVNEEERQKEFDDRWAFGGANFTHAFNDLFKDKAANDLAADYVRAKIRDIVKDPDVAAKLTPTDHPIGTKRICVDTDYYATFNRDNVTLIDARAAPITRITKEGIETTDGSYAADSIVFATGYDAVTGALTRIDIRGRNGVSLKNKWRDGPKTYLGIMVAGFPNLFTLTGPGSPSILTNVVMAIEQHVEWVADCLDYMERENVALIEADEQAEQDWVAHVSEVANGTLHVQANSWYMGANIPGKPRVFLPYVGGLGVYTEICNKVVADGYRGFVLSRIA
jgi:cyclohexanone monooxygenase